MTADLWHQLLGALALAPARQQALRDEINTIHAKDGWTKVIVFAPDGAAFDGAARALQTLGRPVHSQNLGSQLGASRGS